MLLMESTYQPISFKAQKTHLQKEKKTLVRPFNYVSGFSGIKKKHLEKSFCRAICLCWGWKKWQFILSSFKNEVLITLGLELKTDFSFYIFPCSNLSKWKVCQVDATYLCKAFINIQVCFGNDWFTLDTFSTSLKLCECTYLLLRLYSNPTNVLDV